MPKNGVSVLTEEILLTEEPGMLDEVFESLERINIFEFELFGYQIHLSNNILVMWIIMAALIAAAVLLTRNLSVDKPRKSQCVVEMLVGFVDGSCKGQIGRHWRTFMPYIGTLLLFLAVSNMISVFNFFPFVHLYPPTKDINVTGAFAAMTILIVIVAGFRYKGFVGWAKSLVQPIPVMLPFNLLEYATKPLSLCLRLFGNIVAAFLIMELLMSFLPLIAAPFSAFFDLFDGILQAYIFVYLTTLYIGEAVETHH